MYDLIIIGGGIAGFSAAMYAKRYELKILLISELDGGTITKTHLVENYPGFTSLSGYELAQNIINHAKAFNVKTISATVNKIEKNNNNFIISTKNNENYQSKTVIWATGTEYRKLGLESEKKLTNKGVSYCATCDGFFFKDKIVGVVGGSDSAVKEALLLCKYASQVYIIYRGEQVHPEPINLKRMQENSKIKVINEVNITEVLGTEKVTGIKLDSGEIINLEGLFIEIGRIPNTTLLESLEISLNKKKEVIINKKTETNLPGFFAAGDVTDTEFKQAIISAAEGSQAANSAFEYLSKNF